MEVIPGTACRLSPITIRRVREPSSIVRVAISIFDFRAMEYSVLFFFSPSSFVSFFFFLSGGRTIEEENSRPKDRSKRRKGNFGKGKRFLLVRHARWELYIEKDINSF